MSTAFFASHRAPIQPTEPEVLSTLDPVEPDNPPAETDSEPEYNQVETYPYNVGGPINRHDLTGHTEPSERYLPWHSARAENTDYAQLINEQVSTSGTAAARESAGVWGHGTMQRTETIEPQIRDGAEFGSDYFAANQLGANETGGDYMTAQVSNNQANAIAQAFATDNAHVASQSTLYGAWLAGE